MIDLFPKFRIWENILKYYPFIELAFGSTELAEYNKSSFRIEEWAYLKDMNDKLLYEGDLFKSTHDDFIFRVWKVRGGFAINVHYSKWQKDIKLDYPFPLQPLADEQTVSWFESNCYIIGNINQNPEYLKDFTDNLK